MLVLQLSVGKGLEIRHRTTGEVIRVECVRTTDESCRIGLAATKDWEIHRDKVWSRIEAGIPRRKIQADESDVADLGRRDFDPLEIAEAYE